MSANFDEIQGRLRDASVATWNEPKLRSLAVTLACAALKVFLEHMLSPSMDDD